MRFIVVLVGMWATSNAFAQDGGIPVSVRVVDIEGKPIATAVVRHPEEKERHRVNMENGTWTGEAVYLEDGTELLFQKNMEIVFEVSAPGYKNERVPYLVRKRKNLTLVTLTKMDIELEPEETEDGGPSIGFKHDQPRD
jgi:hypothetical protein